MKWDLRRAGGTLLGAVAVLAVLSACAGSPGATSAPAVKATAAPPAPVATAAVAAPTAAPKVAPTAAPTTAPAAGASLPAKTRASSDLLAQGKTIFEKTAGGVGCAHCHGIEAKGNGVSGVGAPDIRGAPEAKARAALAGGVPLMSFIKLTDEQITAVVAYLQYLNDQP